MIDSTASCKVFAHESTVKEVRTLLHKPEAPVLKLGICCVFTPKALHNIAQGKVIRAVARITPPWVTVFVFIGRA